MNKIEIPAFANKKELFAFLLQNKKALIAQKKAIGKECDPFDFNNIVYDAKGKAWKATPALAGPTLNGVLNVQAVINTTNWLDSCMDVHMPGLWDKSLQDNKMLMHLKEHSMKFEDIIADGVDLRAYVKTFTWQELGFAYTGKTQALVFNSNIKQSRNPYMFDQYAKGYVKNHSVFMMYVKMVLCINEPDSTDYGAEFEAWEKYFPQIINKEFAEEMGFFFAQLEAKVIEGSAVPRGANVVTPTLSAELKKESGNATPSIYKLNLSAPGKGFAVGKLKIDVNKL